MSVLNVEVKRTLEDIIDVAYGEEPFENLKNYKRFWLEIIPKECKSLSGKYVYANRKSKIEIFNLSQESKAIVKCCIHELAHHIDHCKNGTSGHQEPFYNEYKTLLYAALNMHILVPEDIEKDEWSSDRNKVKKLVDEWTPAYIPYKQDLFRVNVTNGFPHKTALKENGYHWDTLQSVWTKEVPSADVEAETEFLSSLPCEFTTSNAADLNIAAYGFIVIKGNTYSYKDELKEQGFFFDKRSKNKQWKKKVKMSEAKQLLQDLSESPALQGATFQIESAPRRK